MGIKEKLDEIIANLQLIKNEQEDAKRELEKQNRIANAEPLTIPELLNKNLEFLNNEMAHKEFLIDLYEREVNSKMDEVNKFKSSLKVDLATKQYIESQIKGNKNE